MPGMWSWGVDSQISPSSMTPPTSVLRKKSMSRMALPPVTVVVVSALVPPKVCVMRLPERNVTPLMSEVR